MRKLILICTFLTSIFSIGFPILSQPDNTVRIEVGSVYDVEYPTMRLSVGIVDDSGNPVTDLTMPDFNVMLNDEERKIISVEQLSLTEQSLSIVLIIDTSDSMGEVSGIPTNLEIVTEAVNLFLNNLSETDEIAIITFGDRVSLREGFTSDFEKVRESIGVLETTGRTALYDATFAGVTVANSASNSQRFVVLLTDGWEDGGLSTNGPQVAIDRANATGVSVYTIGLGSVERDYLSSTAEQTNGQFYTRNQSSQLPELYDNLVSYLRNQYVITIDTSNLEAGDYTTDIQIAGFEVISDPLTLTIPTESFVISDTEQWTPLMDTVNDTSVVYVPTGCFMMGSDEGEADESPAHEQCINTPFYLDQLEVTNERYGTTGYFRGNDKPRDSVNWVDATAYCKSQGGRLPTEAEWEYAARGMTGDVYPWGNLFVEVNVAYDGTTNNSTEPVGSFPAGVSWVGAQDMSGNVWEWTSSQYQAYPYTRAAETTDGSVLRVLRGGSANNFLTSLTTSNRFKRTPTSAYTLIGFRCAYNYPLE